MADRVVGNLSIKLDFDGAKFEKGITDAKRELASYGKATKMSTQIAKDSNFERGRTVDALNNMQVKYKALEGTIGVYNKTNEKLIADGKQNSGQFEKNLTHIQNLEYEMYELNEQYKNFQKESMIAQSNFTKVGNVLQDVGGRVTQFGDGISSIGNGLTKVGALGSATIGVFAKQAIEFETGMVAVQKTTNASASEMAVFEEQIRGLSLQMPLAVGELQNLAAQAGQLGVAQKDIANFTETVAKLGTATNLSSEQAGESLARFQNITGSSVDTLENLGSALVHLGNNMAAQESEILNLSMMLAGSMVTVGTAETDILGLSAAMSSLGITAERGGSSMSKLFVDIASYVSSGAEELETFAKVSNMSVSEFKNLFEKDAMAALQAFINGLGETGEAGGDMLAILDELGIGEVRLRDTILRLANGHDVLNEALELSNQGYSEGTALQEEYDNQLNSTASQIQLAKNQLTDLAIDIGQALLPAINELLTDSGGVIDMLKAGVEWFTNLDSGIQKNIVKWTALSVVLGPVLSGVGNMISGAGSLITMLGGMSLSMGELSGTMRSRLLPDLTGTIVGLKNTGTAAVSAGGAKGLGAVTSGIKLLSPWLLGLVGVGGALALGVVWWEKWGKEAQASGERTKKWGHDVGVEADKVLTKFQETSSGVQEATASMSEDVQGNGQKALDGYQQLLGGVTSTVDEKVQEIEGFFSGLDTSTQKILGETTQKHIDELNEIKANAEKIYGNINGIYARAMEENRELTEQEIETIERYHKRLANLQAEAIGGTTEEIRKTRKVLREQLEGMTEEQLITRSRMLQQDLDLIKESHEEELRMINEKVAAGVYSEEEGQKAIQSLRASHAREVQKLLDEEINVYRARGLEEREIINLLQDRYKEFGYTREEVEARVQDSLRATTDEMFALDKYWKDLLTDPVTGEIRTNIPEVIADVHKSEEEWEELNLNIKEANWTTNTLATMDEFLMASGVWDDLDPEVKEMLGDATGFMNEISKSETHLLRWNSLPEEEKLILGNNLDLALNIAQSEEYYNRWLGLPEKDKRMLGNNADLLRKVLASDEAYKKWLALPDSQKKITANTTQLHSAVDNAQKKINSLKGTSVKVQTVFESVYTSVNRAGNSASSNKAAQSGYTFGWARGTNYHPGGLAVVNDQRGGLFRELITLPSGESFIPTGRNVLLDLPKGSKVLRAALTKNLFPDLPQYADGIGTQTVPRGFGTQATPTINTTIKETNSGDLKDIKSLLQTLIFAIENQSIEWNQREFGRVVRDIRGT